MMTRGTAAEEQKEAAVHDLLGFCHARAELEGRLAMQEPYMIH